MKINELPCNKLCLWMGKFLEKKNKSGNETGHQTAINLIIWATSPSIPLFRNITKKTPLSSQMLPVRI
jgi:hypothetical protein